MKKVLLFSAALLAASAVTAGVANAGPARPGEFTAQGVGNCDVGYGLCTETTAQLNLRTGPWTNAQIVTTMPKGARFAPECWVWGTSVNGDEVWYWGTYRESNDVSPISWPQGYAAGYYLATGADPNPNFSHCSDS